MRRSPTLSARAWEALRAGLAGSMLRKTRGGATWTPLFGRPRWVPRRQLDLLTAAGYLVEAPDRYVPTFAGREAACAAQGTPLRSLAEPALAR